MAAAAGQAAGGSTRLGLGVWLSPSSVREEEGLYSSRYCAACFLWLRPGRERVDVSLAVRLDVLSLI